MIHCKNLDKRFGGVIALDDVTVRFPSQGIVAIIGPNGAGKTTLINIITGYIDLDGGQYFLGADDITGLAPHRVAQLGVGRTFQDLRLIELISVLDNVLLAHPAQAGEKLFNAVTRIGVRSEERTNTESAMNLLDFVGLANQATDLAGSLSYGQQKLLTLACCLATGASILMLDEPVAGVHPDVVERILAMLEQLKANGKLVIFIEHDIAAVRAIADIVVVLDQGKVIAQGAPDVILRQPEIMEAYVG